MANYKTRTIKHFKTYRDQIMIIHDLNPKKKRKKKSVDNSTIPPDLSSKCHFVQRDINKIKRRYCYRFLERNEKMKLTPLNQLPPYFLLKNNQLLDSSAYS